LRAGEAPARWKLADERFRTVVDQSAARFIKGNVHTTMHFFKPQYIGKHGVTGWRQTRWTEAEARYQSHLKAIKPRLPQGVIELHRLALHDKVFEAVEWQSATCLRMRLDRLDLSFEEVRAAQLPPDLVGSSWLYGEIHLDPGGFRLEVLCDGGLELAVVARDFRAYDVDQARWLVGDRSTRNAPTRRNRSTR
jgi:hypothetical protein